MWPGVIINATALIDAICEIKNLMKLDGEHERTSDCHYRILRIKNWLSDTKNGLTAVMSLLHNVQV